MSSSSPVTTRRPGVVTVIPPEEHGPAKWFETNPALTVAIAVAIVVLVMGCIFCWIRKRRKNKVAAGATVDQNQNNNNASATEPRRSQDFTITPITPQIRNSFSTASASGGPRPSMNSEDFRSGESFIIIENSPANTNHRQDPKRYKKRKSLAMPPGFYISSRRKSTPSIAPENELRPPRISFARWSTAGLEIHTADMKTNKVRTMSVPCADPNKKLSVPEISTTTLSPGSSFLLPSSGSQVPMVLRRVSQGNNHTIYATTPRPSLTPHGNSESVETDETKM